MTAPQLARGLPLVAAFFALMVLAVFTAPFVGSTPIRIGAVFDRTLPFADNVDAQIFFVARLPRALAAALVGATLAAAGVVFQGLLRNPLATPYTLGVSAGASLDEVTEAVHEELRANGLEFDPDHIRVAPVDAATPGDGTVRGRFLLFDGLEVTHPFLDRRVFELALSLPHRTRLRHGHVKNKPLLRRAMQDLLPVEVVSRRDAADFSCYLRDVYLRYHHNEIKQLVRDSRLEQLGILDGSALRSAIDAGLPDATSVKYFGLILSVELWLRQSWS